MIDRLREALEHPWAYEAEHAGPISSVIVAAARRFLALTETGPDYEAAGDMIEGITHSVWDKNAVKLIVDAALADYLEDSDA